MEQRQTCSVALQSCIGEDSLNSKLNWQTGGQEPTDYQGYRRGQFHQTSSFYLSTNPTEKKHWDICLGLLAAPQTGPSKSSSMLFTRLQMSSYAEHTKEHSQARPTQLH